MKAAMDGAETTEVPVPGPAASAAEAASPPAGNTPRFSLAVWTLKLYDALSAHLRSSVRRWLEVRRQRRVSSLTPGTSGNANALNLHSSRHCSGVNPCPDCARKMALAQMAGAMYQSPSQLYMTSTAAPSEFIKTISQIYGTSTSTQRRKSWPYSK